MQLLGIQSLHHRPLPLGSAPFDSSLLRLDSVDRLNEIHLSDDVPSFSQLLLLLSVCNSIVPARRCSQRFRYLQ